MNTPTIVDLPLSETGLDPRPVRQVRPVRLDHVRHLIEETNPKEWDPIQVRAWPASDPYPPGEEGKRWQVVSGYHRVTAAREMDMPTISSIVVEAPTDAEYTLLAIKGNLRHGLPMSTGEQRAAVQRLRALGMSERDIARQTGIPKGTVHNWLTQRDTNAARPVRTHLADDDDRGDCGADGWHVEPTARPDARVLAQVSATLADFLAGTPTDKVRPADVLAWVRTLPPDQRQSVDADVRQAIMWLTNLHAALAAPDVEEEEVAS